VIVAVFVAGTAIVLDPWGLFPFGPSKWLVVSVGALLFVARSVGRPSHLPRGVTIGAAAFVAWMALAALTGLDPIYAWAGTPERHWGVLSWFLVAALVWVGSTFERADVRALGTGAAIAAGVCGVWAVGEQLGWEPFATSGGSGRPGGPFGSSAYLGAAMSVLAPLAAAHAVEARDWRRLMAGAAAAMGAVALVLSGARAAWLGALVALAASGVAWRAARRRPVGALAAVAVLVVAAAMAGLGSRIGDLGSSEAGGLRGRLDEWRVAMRMVADDPVTGAGPEGHRIAFAAAVDEPYERRHGREPLPDRAHSIVLDTAVTGGIPAAAALLAFMLVATRRALRAARAADPALAGLGVAALAHLTASLFLFPVPEIDFVAALVLGAIFASTNPRAADPRPLIRSPNLSRAARAAAGALAVVALVAGALDVAADRAARGILDRDGTDPDAAAQLRPDVVRHHLAAARGHEATGSLEGLDRALDALDHAADVSPRDPVVARERGRVLVERARRLRTSELIDEALRFLRAEAARDPINALTQLRLGLAAALDGDDAAAERAWLRAEHLAPRSAAASVNLAIAYLKAGRVAEAERAARRALARDPSSDRAQDILRQIDGT
jgi:O-antigen ligase